MVHRTDHTEVGRAALEARDRAAAPRASASSPAHRVALTYFAGVMFDPFDLDFGVELDDELFYLRVKAEACYETQTHDAERARSRMAVGAWPHRAPVPHALRGVLRGRAAAARGQAAGARAHADLGRRDRTAAPLTHLWAPRRRRRRGCRFWVAPRRHRLMAPPPTASRRSGPRCHGLRPLAAGSVPAQTGACRAPRAAQALQPRSAAPCRQ